MFIRLVKAWTRTLALRFSSGSGFKARIVSTLAAIVALSLSRLVIYLSFLLATFFFFFDSRTSISSPILCLLIDAWSLLFANSALL